MAKKQTVTSKVATSKRKNSTETQVRMITAEELEQYKIMLDETVSSAIQVQNALIRLRELQEETEAVEQASEDALTRGKELKNDIARLRDKYEMQSNEYIDTTTGEIKSVNMQRV